MLTKKQRMAMFLTAFVFFTINTNAQKHSSTKWYGIVQQGIVINNSETNVQPGIAAGWKWKAYGLGMASSIDFIAVNSIQYCIDLRRTLKLGKQQLIVFANPGINYVIPTQKEKQQAGWFYTDQQFKNGNYLEMGAGILIGKKKNLFASCYWSRKTYKETYTTFLWNPILSKLDETQSSNKYEINRLAIKLGFMF